MMQIKDATCKPENTMPQQVKIMKSQAVGRMHGNKLLVIQGRQAFRLNCESLALWKD